MHVMAEYPLVLYLIVGNNIGLVVKPISLGIFSHHEQFSGTFSIPTFYAPPENWD